MIRNRPIAIAILALCLGVSAARVEAQDRNPVIVTLAANAATDESIVVLDQIARLTGGSAEVRRRMARLDVAELKLFAEQTRVSAEQVRFRLLLAGFEPAQFKLAGAKQVVVRESNQPITQRQLLAAAESTVRQKYPGDDARVSVRPTKPIVLPDLDIRPDDRVQFATHLLPAVPRAGVVRADISIVVNGKPRSVVPVHLELDVTATPAKGSRSPTPAFNPPPAPAPLEVIVKQRDLVKLVATIGSVRIVTTGEAMQDGKMGDVIRVRNIESNRVVNGRIDARGVVSVDD